MPAEVGSVPVGFGVCFDVSCSEPAAGVLTGGTPTRLLRLSPAGRGALRELRAGTVVSPAGAALARRLFDAGLAHPVPPATQQDLSVVVPAHDRADLLAECLRALGDRYPVLVVDDASSDPDAIAKVAAEHGARLVRREVNGGPAAARNTGLLHVESDLVAFVDSDAVPTAEDLARVASHLLDRSVAAAAPRIVAATRCLRPSEPDRTRSVGRNEGSRRQCALDLGERPAQVAPFTKVSYVPSTVLVVRRSVVDGFEESLRYGEDVDLIWRLHEAGHRVRYDPSIRVGHHEPATRRRLLGRRYRYGTSAAALSRRHPGTFVPLALEPFTAAATAALLARRPRLAALALAAAVADEVLTHRHHGLPVRAAPRLVAARTVRTWRAGGTYVAQIAAPLAVATAVRRPGARLPILTWLLAEPVASWFSARRDGAAPSRVPLDLAENVAYGAGVIAGCLRHRTAAPLRPSIRPLRRRNPR